MAKYFQGRFKPNHPEKYIGNPRNIVYRSSWEFSYMRKLDNDPNVVNWASEEFHIGYPDPLDPEQRRWKRYFPDFFVKRKNIKGKIETFVIEIKPEAQTKVPKQGKKQTKKFITEAATYARNSAKWEAAKLWCAKNGATFLILTEKELFK